jgi:hypothetical protein
MGPRGGAIEAVLSGLLEACSSVGVKNQPNGIYRAWGVGKGEFDGKVVYCDGGSVSAALYGLQKNAEDGAWRKDNFTRPF